MAGNNNFQKEIRSGVDWYIAYVDSPYGRQPIGGYVFDKTTGAQECVITHNPDTPVMFGDFYLSAPDGVHTTFQTFDEALDAANACIAWMDPDGRRFTQHELTGADGLYRVGDCDGKEYIVNAFWSDAEPGYVNCAVYEVGQDGHFNILTPAFYNGYTTIEECVRDLAHDFAPIDNPDIVRVADCSYEIDTMADYQEALEDGRLERPEPLPAREAAQSDPSLDSLKQQAKERAAEKNLERPAKGIVGKHSPER